MNPPSLDYRMKCPHCATSNPVLRDPLGRVLKCAACKRRYRIHSGGHVIEIVSRNAGAAPTAAGKAPTPKAPAAKTSSARSTTTGFTWLVAGCAAVALLVFTISALWPSRAPSPRVFPALPEDLTPRAEALGQAWLVRDVTTMQRLTAQQPGFSLDAWLNANPPPQVEEQARCSVRVLNEKHNWARLTIRVPGSATELQQTWVNHGEDWLFVPGDSRRAR